MEVKIKHGEEMLDATIEIVDGVMVVSPKEVKFEPKDGDIVYVKTSCDNIIIYKEWNYGIGRYVNFSDNQYLYIDGDIVCDKDVVKEIRPATEEEKKLLFDKLAEEGYEWKPDIKELVKLKWKPMNGQSHYKPIICNASFKATMKVWTDEDIDVLYFDKGWVFKTKEECQEFCNRLNQAIEGVRPWREKNR